MGVNIIDATPRPDPDTGAVDKVAKLLQEARNPAPAGKPEPIDTLAGTPAATDAESQGTETEDPQESFYKTKVRIREGVEPTVEEMKDAYRTKAEADEREAQLNREAAEWRADQLAYQRERNEFLAAIDPQTLMLRPDGLQMLQRQYEDFKSREREKLLRQIPDWGDARKETADRAMIAEHMKGFGISEKEMAELHESRLTRALLQAARDRAKILEYEKAARPEPRKGIEPRKAPSQSDEQKFGQLKAAVTRKQLTPAQAVEQLLIQARKR